MMKKGSIAFNLFGFSLAWLIIALVFTALLLSNLYSNSLNNALKEELKFHLETLAGAVLATESNKIPSNIIASPKFNRPASGWYWQVQENKNNKIDETEGANIIFSPSLIGSILPPINSPFEKDNSRLAYVKDGFGTNIMMIERKISFNNESYNIIVTGNLDENAKQVRLFRSQALIVLGAVGLMLAIMSAIVARFALKPIEKISKAIEKIREGEISKIEGNFPKEIAPLADEVNELLRSNEQIVARAKNQVGNLAHGLKTPLAVLRNEAVASKSKLAKIVLEEGEKMTNIVSSYLDRAQLSARSSIIGKKTNIGEVLLRLTRVMEKLYPSCTIKLIAPKQQIWFRGEEGDFEEILGNIIDNGCKFAKSEVRISIKKYLVNSKPRLEIIVEDDGNGLNDKQLKLITRRGVRLDEKISGSGIGLDIVKELIKIYAGKLSFAHSKMGGVLVKIDLPALK